MELVGKGKKGVEGKEEENGQEGEDWRSRAREEVVKRSEGKAKEKGDMKGGAGERNKRKGMNWRKTKGRKEVENEDEAKKRP
jgi:hypothetical protein